MNKTAAEPFLLVDLTFVDLCFTLVSGEAWITLAQVVPDFVEASASLTRITLAFVDVSFTVGSRGTIHADADMSKKDNGR